jgi:hypothetical protein
VVWVQGMPTVVPPTHTVVHSSVTESLVQRSGLRVEGLGIRVSSFGLRV